MTHPRARTLCLVLAVSALWSVNRAAAQTRCFQKVGGVPGAYNQPPDWWSVGAVPLGSATTRYVDDPRWRGASSFSHVSDTARFRVLVETASGGQRFLVMSWHIRADAMNVNDRLYVGFWDETSSEGNVFRIEKAVATATSVNGGTYLGGAYNGRFFHKVGAGGWLLNNVGGLVPPPLPTWLKNDTRIDVCPGGPCDEWAVRMRIPIDPAADVSVNDPSGVKITAGGVFRFWYQIQDGMSLGTAAAYGWPEGTSVAQEGGSCALVPPNCFPDPNDTTNPWSRVQDTGTCNGDIGLLPGGIYANTAGSIQVNLTGSNAFHAQPTNFMTAAQPGNAIKATFRLANWGSAVGVSPDWLAVCSDQVGTMGSIASMGKFDIQCNWTVPNPCDFRQVGDGCGNGTRTIDQCMLVDLASAGGGGPYFFSPQSAYQNMLFNGASRIVKEAKIDIKGLPAIGGAGPVRDLYVYVKTRNMPAHVASEQPPVDLGQLTPERRERLAKVGLPTKGAVDSKTARQIQDAVGQGTLTYDDVEAIMPTYVAYVWHDTGKTVGSGADTVKLLAPQPSFGMFAWHDGGLNGWRQAFEGQTVTQISPNFYKIGVPSGGSITVTTRITACEWPLCADHHLSRMVLILIVVLLVMFLLLIAILVLRRRTTP